MVSNIQSTVTLSLALSSQVSGKHGKRQESGSFKDYYYGYYSFLLRQITSLMPHRLGALYRIRTYERLVTTVHKQAVPAVPA